MQFKQNRFFLSVILALSIFTSCSKKDDSGYTNNPPPAPVVTAEDRIKDTALSIARDIYLWYNQIPANFNPRTYADPNKIMEAIRPYSIESTFSTTTPVDRFSFGALKVDWDRVSTGISGDFGIGAGFISNTDLRISSVERASPAGLAGVRRGWQITKVNGSTSITTSSQDIAFLNNAIFSSTSTTFTFRKPDGTTVDKTLNVATYQTHPVMVDSVYTIGAKTIGYMVFDSFIGDTVEIKSEMNRVFNRFDAAGVNDVVIDLRYNGGGYVSMAERLSNYLAPISASGNLMMKQQFNDKYGPLYNSSTNFNKLGSLNLPRVFFIVRGGTASASELVINNMLPFMDVKLIGSTTYGKPVGFFPIPVGAWYVFPVSFKTVNKLGQSNYFNGFTPNAVVADGIDKDWGDVTEASFASALKYITTGSFRLQSEPAYTEQPQVTNANAVLDGHSFKGTVGPQKFLK